jgi:hypothetical protein
VRYGLLAGTDEPNNLHEALKDNRWKSAMNHELEVLAKNKTWHLVPPKQGANIIDCRWVYQVKKRVDGSIDRYNVRLVVKGFKQ